VAKEKHRIDGQWMHITHLFALFRLNDLLLSHYSRGVCDAQGDIVVGLLLGLPAPIEISTFFSSVSSSSSRLRQTRQKMQKQQQQIRTATAQMIMTKISVSTSVSFSTRTSVIEGAMLGEVEGEVLAELGARVGATVEIAQYSSLIATPTEFSTVTL